MELLKVKIGDIGKKSSVECAGETVAGVESVKVITTSGETSKVEIVILLKDCDVIILD